MIIDFRSTGDQAAFAAAYYVDLVRLPCCTLDVGTHVPVDSTTGSIHVLVRVCS